MFTVRIRVLIWIWHTSHSNTTTDHVRAMNHTLFDADFNADWESPESIARTYFRREEISNTGPKLIKQGYSIKNDRGDRPQPSMSGAWISRHSTQNWILIQNLLNRLPGHTWEQRKSQKKSENWGNRGTPWRMTLVIEHSEVCPGMNLTEFDAELNADLESTFTIARTYLWGEKFTLERSPAIYMSDGRTKKKSLFFIQVCPVDRIWSIRYRI
jgi:hypothetical protein